MKVKLSWKYISRSPTTVKNGWQPYFRKANKSKKDIVVAFVLSVFTKLMFSLKFSASFIFPYQKENIARGTTVPGYWLFFIFLTKINEIKFQFLSPLGAIWIGCKFGLQIALLTLIINVANTWFFLHHKTQGGTNCNGYKFSHQMAKLAWVPILATNWHYLH